MRVIDSSYNALTGVSTTTIATEIGNFTGTATLRDDDKDIESYFAGGYYAELHAIKKYKKTKIKMIRQRINLLNSLLEEMDSANMESATKIIKSRIANSKSIILTLEREIAGIPDLIDKDIATRHESYKQHKALLKLRDKIN
jgi:hypothetical protein